MESSSRRSFLKIAGISILGIGAGSLIKGLTVSANAATQEMSASRFSTGPKALTAKRWGMVVDTRKLTDQICTDMQKTCHQIHNVPDFIRKYGKNNERAERDVIKWIWETKYHNAFPEQVNQFPAADVSKLPVVVLCNHCENPPCVRACPTQATFKRASDGIVMMDYHRCIGCRFCMAACPYGSRSFNFRDPRPAIYNENPDYPTRTKGVVEKCDFCVERLAVGKMPACVEVSKGALAFGDLDDPKSDVRNILSKNFTIRRKPNLGTNPSIFYII